MKNVKQILYGNKVNMGGIQVRQPLPTTNVEQADPFLLVHHLKLKFSPNTDHKSAGVGPHPHRGFSPVSFVFDGVVGHQDSRGNKAEVSAGGVQWMNAGMGIIHSERPGKEFAKTGGTQELIQLWVNSPADRKMDQPYYLAVNKDDMQSINPDVGDGTLQIVSGELNGIKGVVKTPMPMLSVMADLKSNAKHSFMVPKDQSTILYVLSGQISINGHGLVDHHNLVIFEQEGENIVIEVKEDSKLLLLSAEPINEPLATYGPFVLNNQTQIMEAMRDYQMGKMGVLIEEFD